MRQIAIFLGLLLFSLTFGFYPHAKAEDKGFDHTHKAWTTFLQKHVRIKGAASTVEYKSIKSDPQELKNYLGTLEIVTQSEFAKFSEQEKLAFLINAYNAFTIKLIVDHYPVKSIKDAGTRSLSNLGANPWKTKFFKLLGKEQHLDNVEHDMIRMLFNEPRIHFAVVCASIGCPALRNEAFQASQIDRQLEEAATSFLSDTTRNRYVPDAKKLELSSIFKWYRDDFTKKHGSLVAFIAPRITTNPEYQKIIQDKKTEVSYLDYDWSLNEEK